MLDIRKIKENPDAVKAGLKAKEVDCDAVIDRILELDVEIRALKTTSEGRTAQKNKIAKENGKLYGMKKGLEKKGESTAEEMPRSLRTPALPSRSTKRTLPIWKS